MAGDQICIVSSGFPEMDDWAKEVCMFCKGMFHKEETAKETLWDMKEYGAFKKLKDG